MNLLTPFNASVDEKVENSKKNDRDEAHKEEVSTLKRNTMFKFLFGFGTFSPFFAHHNIIHRIGWMSS